MLTTPSFSVREALTKHQAARARCWVFGGNQTRSLLSWNSQALSLFLQARKRARTQFKRGSTGRRRGTQSLRYSIRLQQHVVSLSSVVEQSLWLYQTFFIQDTAQSQANSKYSFSRQ